MIEHRYLAVSACASTGRAIAKERRHIQSSTRILLVDPQKVVAKRTVTADVASRRHRTAVTTNAGLNE